MIDRLIEFAVRQRALVIALVLLAAIVGGRALIRLPIDAVPDITNRQVTITTVAPALGSVEMERQVAFPIETALAGTPGLESTRSLSRNGFAQVTAVFEDRVDIYFARQQVAERLATARERLPAGVDPRIGPVTTGLGEVAFWTVEYRHPAGLGAKRVADGVPGWQRDGSYRTPEGERLGDTAAQETYLRTVQDWVVRPQLATVPQVAGVDVLGGYVKQYLVAPDPVRLAALGLTLSDLADGLERANLAAAAGVIERGGEGVAVRADARVGSGDDIAATVIGDRAGTPVRVGDVATVSLGHEVRTGAASENGRGVVVGVALMLAGANSRTVAQAVDVRLAEVNRTLPADIVAKPLINRSKLVNATITTVATNLAEGALLVIVVLFLMLGNFRAAAITALVIPLSLLLAATGMVELGVSGNLMSLGALDFGIIVDGAVIIVENCLRRIAERQREVGRVLTLAERLDEVTASSREMVRPSLFGQAIILLVYLPLLTFEGVEGKMFAPMAITVMLALAAAFVLSLTFVPAMVALLLSGCVDEHEPRALAAVRRRYTTGLDRALARPWWPIGAATLGFVLALVLFTTLGHEFIPQLDEGDVAMEVVRIPSVGVEQSAAMQQAVERAAMKVPQVEAVFSRTGTAELASDPMPASSSDAYVLLKPRKLWPDPRAPKVEVLEAIERGVAVTFGNRFEFSQPIQLRFNELIAGVRADLAIRVYGDDFDAIRPAADAVARVLGKVPGAADVRVEQTDDVPTLSIKFDRVAIATYGLTVGEVADQVRIALGGREAGQVFEGDRRFDIVVRLPEALRQDLDALGGLPIKLHGADGGVDRTVLLRQLVRFETVMQPNQVARDNGKRRIVVQANIRGRDLGGFVADAQSRVAREVVVPPGSWLEWGGQFQNLARAQERLTLVVPAVFLVILALLYVALGTLPRALMVFSAVPLALTGGVLALALRGMPFSISAAVGFIALSGVAVLNGLVMVTAMLEAMERGAAVVDAVREGALARLRPVLMTALVASLGFVPMALATGTGAEVQRPVATVVIGGLLTATALTLFVLPALCRLVLGRERRAGASDRVMAPAE